MKNRKNLWLFLSLVIIAGLSRLLPHPPNFTVLGSMALFGGAVVSNRLLKYAIPIGALLLSDLVLNNTVYASGEFSLYYPGLIWVYGAFIIITFLGTLMKKVSVMNVAIGSIVSAVFFFVFTNFGYWLSGTMYPMTAAGLAECYALAIPFFGNTLASTAFFSVVLFGGNYLLDEKVLKPAKA